MSQIPTRITDLPTLLELVSEPARSRCLALVAENRELFASATSSLGSLEAPPVGWVDHVLAAGHVARVLYAAMNPSEPASFTLSSALIVLFLHQIEMPWALLPPSGEVRRSYKPEYLKPWSRYELWQEILNRSEIRLSDKEWQALQDLCKLPQSCDLRPLHRSLATFCHACDLVAGGVWQGRNHPST